MSNQKTWAEELNLDDFELPPEEESASEEETIFCVACNKNFKSEKQ